MKNKNDIIEYLKANPTWVLQHCRGVRDHNWWWLRNTAASTNTIALDGRAAKAASRLLKRLPITDFRSTDFGLDQSKGD